MWPDYAVLLKLPDVLGVTADWLFLERGPMLPGAPKDEKERAFDAIAAEVDRVRAATPKGAQPESVEAQDHLQHAEEALARERAGRKESSR